MTPIEILLEKMQMLRDPKNGCSWDLEQTMESIVPHTLEEAYELAHAIETGATDDIRKESGDLLFQVLFYAQIAKDRGDFDFDDICRTLHQKLIDRHPFFEANHDAESMASVAYKKQWELKKTQERDHQASTLGDIPRSLPSLSRAQKIQTRVAALGFDWENIDGVLDKIEEEISEVREAINQSKERALEECGDLLLACASLAHWLGGDAEQLLRKSCDKFETRFNELESKVRHSQKNWSDYSLDELDILWRSIKENEQSTSL